MKFSKLFFTLTVVSAFTLSCSKDDGETITTPGNTNPPISERQKAVDDYNKMYLTSNYSAGFEAWNGNSSTCKEGTIKADAYTRILNQVKYFRKICGLPYENVTINTAKNPMCQKMALMGHANNYQLNHNPPSTWKCYTADGASVSKGNLVYHTVGLINPIEQWVDDPWTGSESVGHRRWILASRMKKVSYGSTGKYAVLYCHDEHTAPLPSNAPSYHSYPPKYIPSPLVFKRWSFSVPNTTVFSGVDFSNATVTMTDDKNNPVQLTIVSKDGTGMGDMTLVWEPKQIVTSSTTDVTYTVKVNNVNVKGQSKNYEYTVTIFKP